jgi:hypothetical protein
MTKFEEQTAAREAAWEDYKAELKRIQKEKQND